MQTDIPAARFSLSRALTARGTRRATVIRLLVGAVFLSEGVQMFLFPILRSRGFRPMAHHVRTDWSMFFGSLFLRPEGAAPWSVAAGLGSGIRQIGRRAASLAFALVAGLSLPACQATPAAAPYQPQRRDFTITTVPLLTKEMQKVYPFLAESFAPGGLLAGKEVYAFMPSTVTAVEGDTIQFHFVNPEDDLHSFVLLPDLSVALPGLQATTATYVARQAGVFTFTCSIPAHLPAMWGQLVVLSPRAIGQAAAPAGAGAAHGS